MAGKKQMLPAGTPRRKEVVDRIGAAALKAKPLDRKAERRQRLFEQIENAGRFRRHGRAGDKRLE